MSIYQCVDQSPYQDVKKEEKSVYMFTPYVSKCKFSSAQRGGKLANATLLPYALAG